MVLGGNKIYVSNWGGRRPDADSLTGPAGQGTRVRVDERSIASEGSVSVIDLDSELRTQNSEIVTGLHACALALSPNGKFLVVANAGSDTLSVIDTRTDKIVETICARQNPADLFGAQPNALAFDRSGRKLFVCNGTQNAVAVFQFKPGESKLLGLIPVGWFPGAIAFDARRETDLTWRTSKASARKWKGAKRIGQRLGFNTKQYAGSLSLVPRAVGKGAGGVHANRAGRFALPAAGAGEIAAARQTSRRSPCPSASASRAFSSTSFTSSRKTALTTRCSAT